MHLALAPAGGLWAFLPSPEMFSVPYREVFGLPKTNICTWLAEWLARLNWMCRGACMYVQNQNYTSIAGTAQPRRLLKSPAVLLCSGLPRCRAYPTRVFAKCPSQGSAAPQLFLQPTLRLQELSVFLLFAERHSVAFLRAQNTFWIQNAPIIFFSSTSGGVRGDATGGWGQADRLRTDFES